MQRVERRAAVYARVKVAPAGTNFEMEIERAAGADREDGRPVAEQRRVEDHARVRLARVLIEELDDRRAADFLFAVAAEADVDGQAPFAREVERGAQERPELALVVRHSPRVEPAVPDLG